MGKARKISLKTRTFDKVSDATAFFKEMLNRYAIGEKVSAADALDLTALVERHDERVEKVGTGIVNFEVNTPPTDVPQFSQRCFWIIRSDETRIDFSIGYCLKPHLND